MKSHYKSFFDLNGKAAVVTGAVGILGHRFCRGLAEFGARIAVVDLEQDRCSAFAQELVTAGYQVAVAARNLDRVRALADSVGATAFGAVASSTQSLVDLFRDVDRALRVSTRSQERKLRDGSYAYSGRIRASRSITICVASSASAS